MEVLVKPQENWAAVFGVLLAAPNVVTADYTIQWLHVVTAY